MSKRDLLSLADLEPSEILYILDRTEHIATGQLGRAKPLMDKVVGIYFRKTSTRTRTSFTVGSAKLGATVVAYGPHDLQTNTGETVRDTAKVLSHYLDALVIRTAESIDEMKVLAQQDRMSIINAMNDKEHPTQALADLAMLQRHFGGLTGLHILYLGEGNSTAAGLALAISKMRDMSLTLLTPEGYGLPQEIFAQSQMFARRYSARVEQYHCLDHLPRKVDVVYTARWQTTGSSKSDPNWRERFTPFGVTQDLMAFVSKPAGTIFMHDLPAVRNEDVASEVLDGRQSIAFQQAGNKLFGAMAVLEWCLLDHEAL
jgi:ornithine carbamoyltransferase